MQTIQGGRHDRAFDSLCSTILGPPSKFSIGKWLIKKPIEELELNELLCTLKDGTRPNVKDYSVSLAADVAAAYYEVNGFPPTHSLQFKAC